MKESRSTELISSKSSTPSVSPDREERFSQFPENTSRCHQSEQELPVEKSHNRTRLQGRAHADSGAGRRKHSIISLQFVKLKNK